jgi:NitT/TauT family transport system substrate-binding protein
MAPSKGMMYFLCREVRCGTKFSFLHLTHMAEQYVSISRGSSEKSHCPMIFDCHRILRMMLPVFFLLVISPSLHSQQLRKVTLAPHWSPQAQFAGYYVGLERGIYKKAGIDLKIITGGPNVSSSALLRDGKVDFSLMWLSNAIQMKSGGAKIVNIAQVVSRSSLMLVAKKSKGIHTPSDMNGKTIGIWGGDFQIQPMAFFRKYNLNVRIISQGNSINLFFFDGIDVTSAMWYNEYHTILDAGLGEDELDTFFFSDYGLNFPEEGIYCSERLLQNDPQLCADFVNATLKGWQYAFSQPEDALDVIMERIHEVNLPTNRTHQQWMLMRMKDLIFPSGSHGTFEPLSTEGYSVVAEQLKGSHLIRSVPRFEELYQPVSSRRSK